MSKLRSSTILFILLVILACTKDKANGPEDDNTKDSPMDSIMVKLCDSLMPNYNDDIALIINTSCAKSNCHNSVSAKDGRVMETYNQVKAEAQTPKFICSIKHEPSCDNMPRLAPKLSTESIKKIECWVENDFPEN